MQMKLPAFSSVPVLLVLLVGCKSTGVDTSSATVSSLEGVRDALAKSEEKVDTVVNSLNALTKVEGDMKGQWRNYVTAVSAVEADSAQIGALRDNAKARKAEYLRGWEQRMTKIQDADLHDVIFKDIDLNWWNA